MVDNKSSSTNGYTLEESEIANDLQLLSESIPNGNDSAEMDGSDSSGQDPTDLEEDVLVDHVSEEEEEEIVEENEVQLLRSLMAACRIGDLKEVKRCVNTNRVNINQHDPKSIYGVSF